jgi:hypothetical protein
MGALPKNKITRAERGKRRRGNTPSLKRDANIASVPLHKRGLVASFLKLTGLGGKSQIAAQSSKKAASSKQAASINPLTEGASAVKNRPSKQNQAVKGARKTQHKG